MTKEVFSWKKFLGGVFSPELTTKWIAMALNIIIVLGIIYGVILCISWTKQTLFPSKVQMPDVVTAETANINKSSNATTIWSLFSFGSSGKQNK